MSNPQQPGMDADQVARLQQQLDEANAEVAKVQAQLSSALPGPGAGAGTGGTAGPPMPAAGTTAISYGQVPGVVNINGQDVRVGDGHQLHTIVDALKAAHNGTPGVMPTILVNGQQVQPGTPVDIASMFTPEQMAKIQSGISQVMTTHPEWGSHLQGLFAPGGALTTAGGAGSGQPPYGAPSYAAPAGWSGTPASSLPSPTTVAPLSDPPRHVPIAYRLATFDLSIIEIFVLLMFAVAPIAIWMLSEDSHPIGLLVASAGIIAWRVHRYGRIGMLKWGKVAQVTGTDLTGAGTYYSGTTYQNMRMRQATGWTATTRWYSGPGYKTKINYTLDGHDDTFTLHGLEYTNGVVLASSKHPDRAMCVSAFPYDVTPGPDGRWPGRLTPWLWAGIICTIAIEAAVFYLTVLSVMDHWF